MENNNKAMPHIRRVTHLMMMAHRSCFDFHLFNSKESPLLRRPLLRIVMLARSQTLVNLVSY